MNPRPLEKIDALTAEQRQQLADWLLTETLDKTRELAEQEFGADMSEPLSNSSGPTLEHR